MAVLDQLKQKTEIIKSSLHSKQGAHNCSDIFKNTCLYLCGTARVSKRTFSLPTHPVLYIPACYTTILRAIYWLSDILQQLLFDFFGKMKSGKK